MYKKILVTLDNSPTDEAILNHIWQLAKLTGAQLVLIHVADGFGARWKNELNLEDSEEILLDKNYLEQCQKRLADYGLSVQTRLCLGEPSTNILGVSIEENCDLIAMATHGHKLFKDFILGSVADKIRHSTNIPILMIKAPS